MKIATIILFSIIGVFASAQMTDNKEEISIYLKGFSWFTKPSEYRADQQIYQNKQAIYCCEFNSDSLLTEYNVYFESGQVAVHSKAIDIKKVFPGSDTLFYFLKVKYYLITYYQDGKIRSIEINTGDITSFDAYNKKGKIIFQELTIDEKHIDGLILTDMNDTEMILNYYQKGDLIAIVKTDYYFNSSSIEFCRKTQFLYRKKIMKILRFKFLGE